ncbi:MAG: hypothetical protein GQ559_09030 [Desulfobulbaceae bacterium]|nr:hypothetical protein [Desulfobulbaceae bacterium]
MSIPFVFESQSILYKFGADKVMLRAGKVLGIAAGFLLFLQIVFSARLKILDQIFALDRLHFFHRLNAVFITTLILLHPVFVLAPEGLTNFSFDLRSWPEMVGACLLALLFSITVTGLWRLKFKLSFDRWLFFHRLATTAAVALLVLHVLFVSDTFKQGIPRVSVFLACGLYFLLLTWMKVKPRLLKKKPWLVSGVTKLAADAFSVELTPAEKTKFSYFPGQFAFLSFASQNISAEEHPFTISSSPTRPMNVSFTVRCCGDWTWDIGRVKAGDSAFVDGPYGRFSYLRDKSCEIIMIAGGIGITPMLSMLRHMADTGEDKRVTMIWSNQTRQHVIYEDELNRLQERLPLFRLLYFFTRESAAGVGGGRLDQVQLQGSLENCNRQAAVFLCGPPPMIRDMRRCLPKLGFAKRKIHWEKFSL